MVETKDDAWPIVLAKSFDG